MDDKLNQWLAFIDDYKGERARMAEEKNDVIKKARVEMNYLTGEEAEKRLQWLREKWEMDYNSDMGQAKREGMKAGLEEGIKKGLEEGREEGKKEVIKKMLKANMPIEQISELTEVKREVIEKIMKKIEEQ